MPEHKRSTTSPRAPGRPRAAEGLDTREVLMRAGLQLFAARGYAGVAVGEIAEAAGLSTPVIYQRFDSKAGLFVAVAEDCYRRGLDHLRPAMAGVERFEDAVDAILGGFASLYRIDRDICRMVLTVLVEVNRNEELGDQLAATLRTFRSFFDGVADLAGPEIAPDSAARRDLSRALVAVSSGLTSAAVMMSDADDYDRMVEMMRGVLLARLGSRR
ncbi:MAG: TetR/AcrR family transcriptional regulator [Propionibacteriales bacterium]|nr:TetR/AcrR family transcriptional regulator [Propionibacteriales bacterium]